VLPEITYRLRNSMPDDGCGRICRTHFAELILHQSMYFVLVFFLILENQVKWS
jgi:hypothetical protein